MKYLEHISVMETLCNTVTSFDPSITYVKNIFYPSSLFVNAKTEFQRRRDCSAVVNIEAQGGDTHWVGAGEASLWTLAAIEEFVSFVFEMYDSKLFILHIKAKRNTCVVDMSLIWLWYLYIYKSSVTIIITNVIYVNSSIFIINWQFQGG